MLFDAVCLGRQAVACALCTSLLTSPVSTPSALALERPALSAPAATEDSPIAEEVWALLDKYYLDRTFNGVNWRRAREELQASRPLTEDQARRSRPRHAFNSWWPSIVLSRFAQALEASKKLVNSLGDRYSRVLPPVQAINSQLESCSTAAVPPLIKAWFCRCTCEGAAVCGCRPPSSASTT